MSEQKKENVRKIYYLLQKILKNVDDLITELKSQQIETTDFEVFRNIMFKEANAIHNDHLKEETI